MLKFILGRAGMGKTYMIRKIILEKVRLDQKKLLLLVPEQTSFENERVILNLLGAKSSRVIDVVSFTSLVNLVFRKAGGFAGRRLDDGGRSMIMSLAIEQVRSYLNIYKRHSEKMEFVELMLDAAREFKACSVRCEDIEKIIPNIKDESLRDKLKETSLILNTYDAIVKQSYVDPLDDLTRLYEILLENNVFSGYTVFIDAFDSFTTQQLRVLECIMKQANDFYISICADDVDWSPADFDIFSPVRKTATQILSIAKRNNIEVDRPIRMQSNYRFSNDALRYIEEGIFRSNKKMSNEQSNNVCIFQAKNIYDELDFVARHIKKLVFEENFNYRDIVVISRETEPYEEIAESVFSRYDIPFFMDRRESIDLKPLVSLVLTVLDIVTGNFKSENIFKFLKTGLLPFSVEEIAVLENYVLLWNITGKSWLTDFDRHPRGFVEKFDSEDEENLRMINDIRRRVVEPIEKFTKSLDPQTGLNISRMIYLLLEDLNVDKKITEYAKSLEDIGEKNLAEEQFRLWDTVMQVLDQIAVVIKDKVITLKRYKELFKVSVNSRDIGFIPQRLDEVKFGSADRIRPNHPRAVFIVGAAQGEFPAYPSSSGIFSDDQRKNLISMGLDLHDSLERVSVKEQLIAYMAIASASEKLYVSWSVGAGAARHPSSIVLECMKIIPNIKILDSENESKSDFLFSEKAGFYQYAKHFNEESTLKNTLRDYFLKSESYKDKAIIFDLLKKENYKNNLGKSNACKLFGKNLCVSASQVEKFYLCRFQYFCKYGIGAKKRKPAVFDALEFGNLVHFVLEHVFKNDCTKENLKREVQKCLDEYLNTRLGGIENKTSRFKYLFSRLVVSIEILVKYIFEKTLENHFEPIDFELEIRDGSDVVPLRFKIPDGGSVKVEGKVDRVDVMRCGEKSFLRIIDYKTGTKQFNLSDVLYGVNMQMLIYMASVMKNGEKRYGKILPAGVLYMPTTLQVANLDRDTQSLEKIDEKRLDAQFKMNGLILDDPSVVAEMEKDSKMSTLVNLSEMGVVLKKVESLVVEMSKSLCDGDISVKPVCGTVNSCEYCEYASICGFENGDDQRKIQNKDKHQLMQEFMKK